MCRSWLPTSADAMVIAPHQDDETFGCGGLIALKRQRGVSVQIVFLTNGGSSPLPMDETVTRQTLPDVRIREALAATHALGVPEADLHFLGFPDSKLKELPEAGREKIVGRLRDMIVTHQIAEVFAPHWDDGHGDHEAACNFALQAIRRTHRKIDLFQYSIWRPWLHPLYRPSCLGELRRTYRLPIESVMEAKNAATSAYASQVATLPRGFLARFSRPYELFFTTAREPRYCEKGK